jgi:hypothetical protein
MKQFAERGMDKAGIKLIGPGDIADDELLLNMGDAMLGTITARHRFHAGRSRRGSRRHLVPAVLRWCAPIRGVYRFS